MSEIAAPRRNRLLLAAWSELMEDDAFRRFWLMRLASQTASSALTYALMVFTVRESANAVATGGLLLTFVVPSAAFGAFAGVIVDRLPRGLILFLSNVVRALLVFLLMGAKDDLLPLYLISLGLSSVTQFAVPAEAAVLPHVVAPGRMTAANSVLNLGTLAAQVIGMLALAPALLKTTDGNPLLFILTALFAVSAVLITIIPQFDFMTDGRQPSMSVRSARHSFAEGWMTLSRDPIAFLSLMLLVVTSVSILVLATLVPKFSVEVLRLEPENIVFVLAPAAVGIFLGLRLVEWLSDRFDKLVVISAAYVVMAAALTALGLVPSAATVLRDVFGFLDERGSRILATVLYTNVYGFAFTVVMTMGRVLIYERIPAQMQGRVFAAQSVLSNLVAILPVLLAGLLADAVGVKPVLISGGVLAVLAAVWSHAQGSRAVPARADSA